jgi:hypothetical protein
MEMNNSYDENDQEDAIIIKRQQKLNKQCKFIRCECKTCDFCSCEFIIKLLYGIFLFCIFEYVIYLFASEFREQINDKDKERGYDHLLKNTSHRQLISSYYRKRHMCINHKYGCCSIYSGEFINDTITGLQSYKFENSEYILKEDEMGSNCPTLLHIISHYNREYMNQHSCLKEPDYQNKCCRYDITPDQLERHEGIYKQNSSYVNNFMKIRYQYTIDYDHGNCPSVNRELMFYYVHHNDCNPRYHDCHANDMITLNIICGIALFCVVFHYMKNKCRENHCFDCNRYGLLPTTNPKSTPKSTTHRAGV